MGEIPQKNQEDEIQDSDLYKKFLTEFDTLIKKPYDKTLLPEIVKIEDAEVKAASLLAYCIGHGKRDKNINFFPTEKILKDEKKTFEMIMERDIKSVEEQLLKDYIL